MNFAIFFLVFSAALLPVFGDEEEEESPLELPKCNVRPCEGPLAPFYCYGRTVALGWHFFNAYNCSGYGLSRSPDLVTAALEALPPLPTLTRDQFATFCQSNFDSQPILEPAELPDWQPDPSAFATIADPKYREFATALHARWKRLGRKMKGKVLVREEVQS